ncbi:hypothetical protein AP75_06980 [Kaistella haifensis DSM 19056]|uniref:Glycosyl transferase family 1 domain-containing protein n=1 Tax=Kaistella haifensis DSM 19056 TaxID=1450526 RepID=A0A2D0A6N7_9FLAO|nr:glycosyltransferase [Kaistella haifensis]OWK98335.1 hypothetical protein AP75_06980 [Kaistella haifensis DSM 19056]
MIRVKFFPLQAHSLAFGGFEIQMLTLLENLQKHCASHLVVDKIDVWSRDGDYDIAHFWGLEAGNFNNILWAKNSGKKIVITVLLSYYERLISVVYDKFSKYIGYKKFQLEILKLVDAVIVVNDLQKNVAEKVFKIAPEKLFVIPNIVHENFLDNSLPITDENYILCTGNICARKNQVNLAKACLNADASLILVGKVLPGEEEYGKNLQQIVDASKNITWIKGLPESSPELVKLVKNCSVFALLSKSETQPISILEAISMNKQLLLSNRKYAQQSYFKNAMTVDPDNVENMTQGINEILKNKNAYRADPKFLEDFKGVNVANHYKEVYETVMYKK